MLAGNCVLYATFIYSWNCKIQLKHIQNTYKFFPSSIVPWRALTAVTEESSESNWTKPKPLLFPCSSATLQESIVPNLQKIPCNRALVIQGSRFLTKTLPTPVFLVRGSLWRHIILMGFPFNSVWFRQARALEADRKTQEQQLKRKKHRNSMHMNNLWGKRQEIDWSENITTNHYWQVIEWRK